MLWRKVQKGQDLVGPNAFANVEGAERVGARPTRRVQIGKLEGKVGAYIDELAHPLVGLPFMTQHPRQAVDSRGHVGGPTGQRV